MKHILYYNESLNNNNIVFENSNWKIISPKSYEDFFQLVSDKLYIENYEHSHRYQRRFSDRLYLNINKKTDEIILFDFDNDNFYKNINQEYINIYDFLKVNVELLKFYGEIINCSSIIKDNGEFWMVVDDYSTFSDYIKTDNNTRKDLITSVLKGESFHIFSYNKKDFDINEDRELDEKNLDLIKVVLILEKNKNSDLDYDLEDIENIVDYSDVVDIVTNNNLDELEDILINAIVSGHESADAEYAFDDIINCVYDFFKLDKHSRQWNYYKNSKEQMLWLKFNTENDAYRAKFIINKIESEDEIIKYSPPYDGYYGTDKVINEVFNDSILDNIYDYSSDGISGDEISEYYDKFSILKKDNPNMSLSELISNVDILLNANKYNL